MRLGKPLLTVWPELHSGPSTVSLKFMATQRNSATNSFSFLSSFLASAPDFSRSPMKTLIRAQVGSEVALDCRPRASPRAVSSWRKGHVPLRDSGRYSAPMDLRPAFHGEARRPWQTRKSELFNQENGFTRESGELPGGTGEPRGPSEPRTGAGGGEGCWEFPAASPWLAIPRGPTRGHQPKTLDGD